MAAPDLGGDTILVTGAAKRLGRATAAALARAGARVVIHYRSSKSDAESLANEITVGGGRAWTIQADLSKADASDLVRRAIKLAGPISGLVNSASIFPGDTLTEMTEERLAENIRINAWAPFVLSKSVAAQGIPASIVNFLDARMGDYDAKHVSYHLSKRVFFSLTRMMALEFAPRVRVNAVAPGLVLPPEGEDESYLTSLAHTNPLQTHGCAQDVAQAAVFLFANRFIAGQVIYVDGGRHLLGGIYA